MTDVRALLKARRQEARISHPYAAYSSSGQLRCSICGLAIKHASAWEGHLGSKGHRTAVTRARANQQRKDEAAAELEEQQRESTPLGKRKSPEPDVDEDADMEPEAKRPKPDAGFPADFFSDPTRSLPELDDGMDEEEEGAGAGGDGNRAPPNTTQPPKGLDDEWTRFQREVINAPDSLATYQNATIMAEPELAPEVPEGFPQAAGTEMEVEKPVDEEELRRRKEQDERELIMDRLLEEERAQEEADMKVTVMKSRLDALKKKREAAKAARTKGAS